MRKTENSAKEMTFGSHHMELRSVSKIALVRKNYLFCKNDNATENAAIIYTMIGCCKAAWADFRKWTSYFLKHIHEYDGDYSRSLDDFLPATLNERGLVWPVYERPRRISENNSKLVQVSPKTPTFSENASSSLNVNTGVTEYLHRGHNLLSPLSKNIRHPI